MPADIVSAVFTTLIFNFRRSKVAIMRVVFALLCNPSAGFGFARP